MIAIPNTVKPAAIALYTALATLAINFSDANVPALANKPEAAALCALTATALGSYAPPQPTPQGNTAFVQLHALNLSLAGKLNPKTFKHKPPHEDWQPAPPDAKATNQEWQQNYPYWLQGAQHLEAQKTNTEDPVNKAVNGMTASQKQETLQWLQPVLRQANRLHTRFTAAQKTLQSEQAKRLTAALNTAIYGAAAGDATNADDTQIFKSTLANNRANKCDAAAGDSAEVKTLAATLICLCSPDSGGSNAAACFKSTTAIPDWEKTAGTAKTIWGKIKPHCNTRTGTKLTAANLEHALSAVLSLIYVDSGSAYLGTLHTGSTCDGSSGNGQCIKFAGAASADDPKVTGNPWIATITNAIKTLRDTEAAEAEQKQTAFELESLLAAALQAADSTKTTKLESGPTAAVNNVGKQIDCNNLKTNETCAANNSCKWDSTTEKTGNHCKPKDGEEQRNTATQAGAGETPKEGTTPSGCAKHATKAECDADKKDEKPVCAWRKGKDNEPEI
ncbi:Trypanosomal VSG domain containing protein, putative [Trypanosoma equiperdum]|uniref:Trypanosomal VSG domain containing protein, putative n=1 Tax=Trypanosoma equiperdum TaxID=5694 RepID=A0A1G4I337_TRYEQ|nr:Trypanosomal VSG domain containing protein, putative [Trypanosoma equiperdum]